MLIIQEVAKKFEIELLPEFMSTSRAQNLLKKERNKRWAWWLPRKVVSILGHIPLSLSR
jgi:hypothetical protein